MPGAADLARLARTVIHLRPGQLAHRARLRAQQHGLRRFPRAALAPGRPGPVAAVGWPDRFSPVDARIWRNWPEFGLLRQGRIDLLGMTRTLAAPASVADDGGEQGDPSDADSAEAHWTRADWQQADWKHAAAPALWRFHLRTTGTGPGGWRRAGPGRYPGLVRGDVAVLARAGPAGPG